MRLFDAPERWLLSPRLRGPAWQAAVARAPTGAVLWLEHAESLDARAARDLGRAAMGRRLVLCLDVAALRRLALGRLATVCGAAGVVVRAPIAHGEAAARALVVRTAAGDAERVLERGLELVLGPDEAAAVAATPWSALLAADLDVTLQPASLATTDAQDQGAATSGTNLDGWTAALGALPAAVALGEGFAALVPGRGAERPGPRPPWIAALAKERAARPLPTPTVAADGQAAAPTGDGGGLRAPRWRDAAEWIALELGLRRVWRLDLPAAMLPSLEQTAADAGMALRRGAAVTIDDAGLWHAEGADRWLVYVGPHADDLREADARERDTLSLAARRAAGDAAFADGHEVDPAAENDRVMARLLGYPDCCRDAFLDGHRAWTAADAATIAEVAFFGLRALRATAAAGGQPDRRLDFLSPLAGATVLRHYPCRLDCAGSTALAAAIDAEAWRRDPARRQRDLAVRADATLLFASGAAVPLRGTPVPGGIASPQVLDGRRSWAPHWAAVEAQVLPQLQGLASLGTAGAPSGAGGVVGTGPDGAVRPLTLFGGFPEPVAHAEFPRLLVFSG